MAFIPDLKKDFQRLIDNGKLFHSYLFFGEAMDEQFKFTQELANYLENKKWEEPPGILLDALAMKEEGIEAARGITSFLWQKPVKSPRRTLVLQNAERLTTHAQNAILKIAEEPPEHALLILIVRNPETLLWPLQSRFQKIYFSSQGRELKPDEEVLKLVKQVLRAPTPKEKSEIIKILLDEKSGVNLDDFVTVLVAELRKNLFANWFIISEVLHRWTLINQFNVNKKLQLEAALLKQM